MRITFDNPHYFGIINLSIKKEGVMNMRQTQKTHYNGHPIKRDAQTLPTQNAIIIIIT